MEFVRQWVEQSPYSRALGVSLESVDSEGRVRLTLPFAEQNSNPGDALHGGCAASLGAIGAQAVTRAVLGEDSGPWHTAAIQISYLAAAVGETVVADARLLRRGKSLCFTQIDIATVEGKAIASVMATVRARFGEVATELAVSEGDDGAADPGPIGGLVESTPYIRARGIRIEHMTDSHARIRMPNGEANADGSGGVHEGAVLALLDTTGAMASWAAIEPGPFKASTPTMQARVLAPPPDDTLVAYARMLQRDGDLFWADVEVAGESDGKVCARGTVVYRIVT